MVNRLYTVSSLPLRLGGWFVVGMVTPPDSYCWCSPTTGVCVHRMCTYLHTHVQFNFVYVNVAMWVRVQMGQGHGGGRRPRASGGGRRGP